MSDLHPTKTRMELLDAVKAGEVEHHRPLLPEPEYDEWRWDGGRQKVTSRIAEMNRAGWVTSPRPRRWHESTTWEITGIGERVLAEWESRQSNG